MSESVIDHDPQMQRFELTTKEPEIFHQRSLMLGAFIMEFSPRKREYTDAAQRILEEAQQLAATFNQPSVTEEMFLLALLLDHEGYKQAIERGIDVALPYDASLRATRYAAPSADAAANLRLSEGVAQIVADAKRRASEREADISLVAVADLVEAAVARPGASRARTPLELLRSQKKLRNRFRRPATAVVSGPSEGHSVNSMPRLLIAGTAALALIGAVAYLASDGVFDWAVLWATLTSWFA